MAFHVVSSFLLRVLASKTTFWMAWIFQQPIRCFYFMVSGANTRIKKEDTAGKAMKSWARKCYNFLCTINFEVTWPFWKMCTPTQHSKRHNSSTNWHQGMKMGSNNSNKSVFTPDESWYPLLPVQLWAPWSLHPSWFDLPAPWWNWIWALGLSWAWPQAMSRSVWGQPLQCQAFQHHIRPHHSPLLLSIHKYGSYLMYFFSACFVRILHFSTVVVIIPSTSIIILV